MSAIHQQLPNKCWRVLLIDDEPSLVWLMTRTLQRLGYEVNGFSDGQSAVEEFRKGPHSYDVVISDLSMPIFSGFDVAKEILAIRSDTAVIVTTGFVREEDVVIAQELGVRHLVLKAQSMNELGKLLQDCIQESPDQKIG